jgi:hypothetical protein
MAYALIENEQVIEYPIYSLFDKYPNTSFTLPLDNTQFPTGIVEVKSTIKPVIDYTQDLVEQSPIKVDSIWQESWIVVQTPQIEVDRRINSLKIILQNSVQKQLDDFARTRGYDNILSCCTYTTSTVQKFQQEAQYCVQMRDVYWNACYTILTEFEMGQRPLPTIEQLLAELPALEWPL